MYVCQLPLFSFLPQLLIIVQQRLIREGQHFSDRTGKQQISLRNISEQAPVCRIQDNALPRHGIQQDFAFICLIQTQEDIQQLEELIQNYKG